MNDAIVLRDQLSIASRRGQIVREKEIAARVAKTKNEMVRCRQMVLLALQTQHIATIKQHATNEMVLTKKIQKRNRRPAKVDDGLIFDYRNKCCFCPP